MIVSAHISDDFSTAEPGTPAAAATPASEGRLRYIDALRGIAASWVMFYHFYNHVKGPHERVPHALHIFLEHGWLGVDIFFVLSGFVIAYSVGTSKVTARFLGRFALRRSLRLDPLYWLTIAGAYVAFLGHGGGIPGEHDGVTFLANMFYVDHISNVYTLVGVGWTLCLEVQFYLVYVILTGAAQRLAHLIGPASRWVIFLPFAAFSLLFALRLELVAHFRLRTFFYDSWYLFFLGAMVAGAIVKQTTARWTFAYIAVVVACTCVRFDIRSTIGSATALSILVLGLRSKLRTALDNCVLQYLGRISYSLYLTHTLVGTRFMRLALRRVGDPPALVPALALVFGATAISIVASHILNILVERPTIALSRRIALEKSA